MLKKYLLAGILALSLFVMPNFVRAEDPSIYIIDETKPYDYRLWQRNGRYEQKVFEVGYTLLNANSSKNRVAFQVFEQKNLINAFAFWPSSNVIIFKQIFPYIDSDDELAALLAHEIAHIQQSDSAKTFWIQTIDILGFTSKHYEHKADLKGVDLMVKAGYNPIAMLTFLNKLAREDHWFIRKLDYILWFQSHPTGSKRLSKIYNHILINYPQFITQGYESPYYVNFLMNSEKNSDINGLRQKHNL